MKHAGHITPDFIASTTIDQIAEIDISAAVHTQINQLLSSCFSGYPKERSYLKQLPHFRLLVTNQNELIGHAAIDHRLISVGNDVFKIFGLADVCVDEAFQSKNLASQMLKRLEEVAEQSDIDYLLLFTNQQSFYKKNGFKIVDNVCRWVFINDNHTLGVSQRNLGKSIMIKSISNKKWGDGMLDLMGHIF